MALTTRTLTGTFQLANGSAASGQVLISPNTFLTSSDDDLLLPRSTVTIDLDSSGSFTVDLVCTDDISISPTGWGYTVREKITKASGRVYTVAIPTGSGALDLADLTPLTTPPDLIAFLVASQNLADIGNTATARTNLGLGNSSTRAVGTTAGTVAAGDDARFTPGAPTAHASTHASAGSDPVSPVSIGAETAGTAATAVATHTGLPDPHAQYVLENDLGDSATKDVGTVTGTVAAGDDSRLSNARVPTAHAASHASAGSDPVTPGAIGADVTGAGTAAVVTHVGLSDPHTQYVEKAGDTIAGDFTVTGITTALGYFGTGGNVGLMSSAANNYAMFGAVGTTQQTITGTRSDTALADLLTKLASYGLVVDSTTAGPTLALASDLLAVDGIYRRSDYGAILGWTCHLENIYSGGTGTLTAAGVMQLTRFRLPVAATVTNVICYVQIVGVLLSNCYIGLYDSTGTLRASTADQSTPWQTQGLKTIAFTSPYVASAGSYWLGVVQGAGTPCAAFAQAGVGDVNSNNLTNVGLSAGAGNLRSATNGSGLTALPGSFTPSSGMTISGRLPWMAVT